MFKTLTLLLPGVLMVGAGARAAKVTTCAAYLFAPAEYTAHFDVYAHPEHLVVLEGFALDRLGPAFELEVFHAPPEPADETRGPHPSVRVVGSYGERTTGDLHVDGIDKTPDLPPRYTYRLVFAHLLTTFPETRRLTIDPFETPARAEVLDALAEGVPLERAWQTSVLGKVATEFGFRVHAILPPAEETAEEAASEADADVVPDFAPTRTNPLIVLRPLGAEPLAE